VWGLRCRWHARLFYLRLELEDRASSLRSGTPTSAPFLFSLEIQFRQICCPKISEVIFSSFDFLDEHHILYSVSKEDSLYVYDLRCRSEQQQHLSPKDQETEAKTEPVRFQLSLPPINCATTTRYIQLRRNALPVTREKPSVVEGSSSPFHADPRERLIVLRVVTSPVERGEEQFELHVPARVLLEHFTAAQQAGGKRTALPWSAWRDAVDLTSPRRLPYMVQAPMVAYGMRAVAHPPDWDEGLLNVDSYLPRRDRKVGAEAGEGDGDGAENGGGTRQTVRLPNELPGKADFLSVLCEDALFCYKVRACIRRCRLLFFVPSIFCSFLADNFSFAAA
jgi:hypothetical protein